MKIKNFLFIILILCLIILLWALIVYFFYPKIKKEDYVFNESYANFLEQAKDCDLLFFSGDTFGEKAIKLYIQCPLSHIGMFFLIDNIPYIWESDIGLGYKDGPRLIPLLEKIKRSKSKEIVWKKYIGHIEIEKKKILEVMSKYINKDFDKNMVKWVFSNFNRQGESFLIEKLYNYFNDENKIFCSELIAMTLSDLGLLENTKLASSFSPKDFLLDLKNYDKPIYVEL